VVVALVALVAVGALTSSAAAAIEPIKFEWKVKGSTLASGSEKEYTLKNKTSELIHIRLSAGGGVGKYEFTSSKFKVKTAAKILGGKPGKLQATLEFENIKPVKGSENCEWIGEKLVTKPLTGEIVESAVEEGGGKGTGKTEMLFASSRGAEEEFGQFELKTKAGAEVECIALGDERMFGTILAEMSPQKSEAKVGKLLFGEDSSKLGSKYHNAAGAFKEAYLATRGVFTPLTVGIEGAPEIELVSKEVFGAF
jgi:hypothetical protein